MTEQAGAKSPLRYRFPHPKSPPLRREGLSYAPTPLALLVGERDRGLGGIESFAESSLRFVVARASSGTIDFQNVGVRLSFMDINQAARMIEWLDEERRRERLQQQQDFIETLNRRMGGLENDHSSMRAAYLPVGRDVDIMEQMRGEIHQQIEAVEAKRITAEREVERRSEVSRDNIVRPIRELADRMDDLERAVEELPAARVERDRFASALAALQQRMEDVAKKFEEPERRLAFLEEQRRQDSRRISEVQTEIPELQKHIDSVKPKIELIEDLALRNEKRVLEMHNLEHGRREQIQQFIDQQTLFIQQRDQKIEEVTRSFGQYDDDMRRNMERFESWAETYRQMKKIIEDFERLGDRLERRINEVAEMQRLSEERFRQEWNSWNADDQKRWKMFTLSNDDTWRTHDKEFESFRQRISEVSAQFPPVADSLDRLWKLQRAHADLFRDRYQTLLAEHDQVPEKVRAAAANVSNANNSGNGSTNGNGSGNGRH